MTSETEHEGPLSGIRVLELGHFIAAPFAARVLADLGADIIKVEPPGRGDPVRTWGEIPEGQAHSTWWSVHGRNKRTVTADLKKPEGVKLVRNLIEHVDAVIENFKPGQLARWGLGPDDIAAINPEAVLVQISGYGQTGPYADRAAFGVIGEAVGGIRHLSGYPEGTTDLPPVRTGVSLGDSVAGLYGAIGLLAALLERKAGRGRPGRCVDVALTESVLSLLEGCLPEYGALGMVRAPHGSTLPTNAPSNAYPTRDGRWFLIAANSDALFRRLADMMARPDLLIDDRFSDNPSRVRNAADLDAQIAAWTRQHTIDELERIVRGADIPSSRIFDVSDIAADQQFRARDMVRDVHDPRLGDVLHPGVVPKFDGGHVDEIRWTGAGVGAYNEEVFGDLLGMSSDEIEELRSGDII